ncbi:RagB/SusD family nutrient uptake outer membrane protein [Ekhidna sp.]|uniref:RagB/SusD family nutrient uptake outer membrane protein n=1 Tax=Ekhidna sp. TaxID=2608089 RepID=UPI003CCBF2B5
MKLHINKFLIVTVALLGFTACSDELELEPAQSISESLALSTPENIQAVLIGAYDEVGVDDLFGGETLRNSELLAATDELLWAGTFNAPQEMFNKNMVAVNGDATEVWLEAYQTINIANNILSALDVFTDQAQADVVEGESKFIRALIYFELVKFYGLPYEAGGGNSQLGVPLVLTPTRGISEENNVGRSTVEEVYAQILSDLNDAVTNLPPSNGIFATSGSAQALRARVHLQMGNYASALADANAVINSGEYQLEMGSFADAFNNDANSTEDIFAMQVSSQDGVNAMTTYWATPQFGGRDGDIIIEPAHLALYPAGDDRGAFFYNDGGTFTSKYTNQFANVPVIRLAEMYLIRAECNVRLSSATGDTPLNDINRLRTRANAPLLAAVTVNDVLLERRLELAFEGHRLHDIKRLQQNVGTLTYDAPELVFPIPQREIDANPALANQQNPGY